MAHFLFIFQILGAKKNFPRDLALSHTASYGFLAPCQNLEKTRDTILRKCLDRYKDGRTDRAEPFLLPAGLSKKTILPK